MKELAAQLVAEKTPRYDENIGLGALSELGVARMQDPRSIPGSGF